MEPLSNIRLVSPSCAPKSGYFSDVSPESLLGRYVKTQFKSESGKIEHMWVRVLRVDFTDPHAIVGKIDNDPVVAIQYKYGQLVSVKTCQIEQIL
jgi:uncharacterized protein YegJ (DUF2314 family)